MALASDYQSPVTTYLLLVRVHTYIPLCRPDSPSRFSIMTLDPASIHGPFCGEPAAPRPRTTSNHGAVGPCHRCAFDGPHSTPWYIGNRIVRSIMALLSRLRPLVGGCLAEVCGFDPVLSRFHCCYCRPVTKLTGASAASRASGPLIRHHPRGTLVSRGPEPFPVVNGLAGDIVTILVLDLRNSSRPSSAASPPAA